MAAVPSAPPAVAATPAPLPAAVQEVVDRLSAQLRVAFHSGEGHLDPSRLKVESLDAACPLADAIRAHNADAAPLADAQAALESGVLNLAASMAGDADGDASVAMTRREAESTFSPSRPVSAPSWRSTSSEPTWLPPKPNWPSSAPTRPPHSRRSATARKRSPPRQPSTNSSIGRRRSATPSATSPM